MGKVVDLASTLTNLFFVDKIMFSCSNILRLNATYRILKSVNISGGIRKMVCSIYI